MKLCWLWIRFKKKNPTQYTYKLKHTHNNSNAEQYKMSCQQHWCMVYDVKSQEKRGVGGGVNVCNVAVEVKVVFTESNPFIVIVIKTVEVIKNNDNNDHYHQGSSGR